MMVFGILHGRRNLIRRHIRVNAEKVLCQPEDAAAQLVIADCGQPRPDSRTVIALITCPAGCTAASGFLMIRQGLFQHVRQGWCRHSGAANTS
ncbi:hypothetical protein SAMN02744778_02235 [Pantoea sp. GL120224-02]|nr:hypothetical protein SAMN02744778_02235 [Pantoea sp. GL120224-02]